jgi:hypothetical protein
MASIARLGSTHPLASLPIPRCKLVGKVERVEVKAKKRWENTLAGSMRERLRLLCPRVVIDTSNQQSDPEGIYTAASPRLFFLPHNDNI